MNIGIEPGDKRRRYYEKNRSATIARAKAWQQAHPREVLATAARYRERNREKMRSANRRSWGKKSLEQKRDITLRREYGITLEQRDAMEAAQGGRCAICLRRRRLVVDHDHSTNRVRGLLCNSCNVGLGALGDGRYFASAAAYLQRCG